MPTVEFLPGGRVVDVPAGTILLDAARRAGVELESPCGGEGSCGSCAVRIVAGDVERGALNVLSPDAIARGYALACTTRVGDSNVTVEVPPPQSREGPVRSELEILGGPSIPVGEGLSAPWACTVPPAKRGGGLSDLDRLGRAIQDRWGKRQVVPALSVLRDLPKALRAEGGLVTVTLIRAQNAIHIVRIEAGDHASRDCGIAVDLGTTTVAVRLVDRARGRILASASDYNDQIACGLDVISRINYAHRPDRLEELRGRALQTVNRLVREVACRARVEPREISDAVLSGNTTMVHLLLGLAPDHIRLDPYTPAALELPYLTAGEVGIEVNPDSWIWFSPHVGSYVGGDITAGLLCTGDAFEAAETSLYLDVGTNGEVVVGNGEFLMACACSAGPAFEGGGIECGMRAAAGAIERVEIERDSGTARFATIGDARPRGICGSGMIDLVAQLFLAGWIDAGGKLERMRASPAIHVEGMRAHYTIVPSGESATGSPIAIREAEIENILRAKAAIYAACALLLEQLGLGFEDLARIFIAGGFGRFLDVEEAIAVGLLPDVPRDRFRFIGNASLAGSAQIVASQACRRRQLEIAHRMTYVDLSVDPAYMNQYTAALFLPHTHADRFPSVARRIAKARSPAS